jgi:CRISPR system Cascade subunit CasD
MSKFLLLYLEAPEMSFGDKSFSYKNRGTYQVPTTSALIGMICCAMGIKVRDKENLSLVESLESSINFKGVICERSKSSRVYSDYFTCGSDLDKKDPLDSRKIPRTFDGGLPVASLGTSKTYRKDFLQDFSFKVLVEIYDLPLAEKVIAALLDPFWPIFLGRKSCIPTSQVLSSSDIFDTEDLALQGREGPLLPVESLLRYY